MEKIETFKRLVRATVERGLEEAFGRCPDNEVCRVARYTTLGGGHRWRAMVAIAAGRIFDDNADTVALPPACGVELAHAASLILDDLPSMDDAAYRRGKPCAHLAFPAWAVDMAPVFMVTLAYRIALDNDLTSYERRVRTAVEMSQTAHLMIEGQILDMTQEPALRDEAEMLECYQKKSAALYGTAAKVGAFTCGASEDEVQTLFEACMELGMAYQFLDDVADVVASLETVGKQPGTDTEKRTAVDYFGVEGTGRRAQQFQDVAIDRLKIFGAGADLLRDITRQASWAPV